MRAEAGNNRKGFSVNEIRLWLVTYIAGLMEVAPSQIDPKIPFDEYCLDSSISAIDLLQK